jgi:hypothetical protein
MHSAGSILSSALRALNRPYSGSLRRAENITRDDQRRTLTGANHAGCLSRSVFAPGSGRMPTVQFIDCRRTVSYPAITGGAARVVFGYGSASP